MRISICEQGLHGSQPVNQLKQIKSLDDQECGSILECSVEFNHLGCFPSMCRLASDFSSNLHMDN